MPKILYCEECGGSMSSCGGFKETTVGYFSPPGHNHDDNCRTKLYECKNGHKKIVSIVRKCHACNWTGKEFCYCHDGKKYNEWPVEKPEINLCK